MQSLTAIILTRNEEKNIGECLKSIQGFASRAVVVEWQYGRYGGYCQVPGSRGDISRIQLLCRPV